MPYYTKHDDRLLTGNDILFPDGTHLTADTHLDHTYPVQDWWWFDTDTEAYTALLPEMLPVIETTLTTLLARLADARSLEEVRQAAQEATQP
jgi:hypothetical protein